MILVDTFKSKREAQNLINLLEENNIPFIQKSEDAGGKYGSFVCLSGVQIFISEDDVEKLKDLLNKNELEN